MAQVLAGEKARASKVGLAGTQATRTSNTSTFTAETVVDTISVPVVSGRTYLIVWMGKFFSSVADGYVRARIRETNISGTVIQSGQLPTNVAASQSFPLRMEVFWTASSTATVTFVATGQRQSGTGNITAQAGTDSPTNFYVLNISGT
jgi:hypothetical protein